MEIDLCQKFKKKWLFDVFQKSKLKGFNSIGHPLA